MKLLIKCFILFAIFISCNNGQEKTKPVIENITESVYASGIVKSENQYQVFPTVNGLIKKILVTEGQEIKMGEPIINIDNEAAQLGNENAKIAAEYNAVNANTDKLNEFKANIALTKSKMENDSLLLERQRDLWEKNIGSRIELEQRALAFQNSSTNYSASLLRYNDLLKQLNFSSRQSNNNFQISSTIAADYTIKSNIDGKIYSILKEQGEIVNPQTPVAIIGDATNFIIELQVDEFDISKIIVGQKIIVSMDSYKDQIFEAVIKKIFPILNDRTKSFTVEANFISQPPTLYPNLTVEANIVVQTKSNVLTIPREFLLEDSFVLLSNKEKRKIVTGLKDYKKVEIVSGLSDGEIILKPVQ